MGINIKNMYTSLLILYQMEFGLANKHQFSKICPEIFPDKEFPRKLKLITA